jgi:hypothetical protein
MRYVIRTGIGLARTVRLFVIMVLVPPILGPVMGIGFLPHDRYPAR